MTTGMPDHHSFLENVPTDVARWRLRFEETIPIRSLGMSGSLSRQETDIKWKFLIHADDFSDFVEKAFPADGVLGKLKYPKHSRLPNRADMGLISVEFKDFITGKPIDPLQFDSTIHTAQSGFGSFLIPKTYGELIEVTATYKPVRPDPTESDITSFLEISSNSDSEVAHPPLPKGMILSEALGAGNNFTGPLIPGQIVPPDVVTRQTPVANPNQKMALVIPKTEWTVRWPHVAYDHFRDRLLPKIRYYAGRVNSAAFTIFYGAEKETVLFDSWSHKESPEFNFVTTSIRNKQRPPVDVEFKFIEKRIVQDVYIEPAHTKSGFHIRGWNHEWDEKTGTWKRFLRDTINPMYDLADLNDLFAVT